MSGLRRMGRRRPALLALSTAAATALLAGCSTASPPATSTPPGTGAPGLVVVTAGGTALVDGAADVPPTLDLHVSASTSLTPASVGASLDGSPVALQAAADGGVGAAVSPMPLGSAHTLVLRVPGRDDQHIGFHVVAAGEAYAALHSEPGAGEVLDLALSLAPAHPPDVVGGLPPGGSPQWSDPRHLRATWPTAPSGSVRLPAGLALDRGSTLGTPVDLTLTPAPARGTLRATLATAPNSLPQTPVVVAFSVATAASRASVAAHAEQLSILSPTGLTTAADGTLSGSPDEPAAATAHAAGIPLWPLVQNAGFDGPAVHELLTTQASEQRLVAALRDAARSGGWPGIHLDLESVAATDRDALSALVADLAGGLHTDGRRLAVAVIPHRAGHENSVNAAYDLAAIGRVADLVTLMAYEEHSPSTDPGPVAGLAWDAQILDGSATAVGDPARTLLGMALYARTWGSGGDASADAYAASVTAALSRAGGARVDYDFAQATPSITPLAGGLPVTWFDDASSLGRKLALAATRRLQGVAVWRLGFEDPAFWSLLPARAARP